MELSILCCFARACCLCRLHKSQAHMCRMWLSWSAIIGDNIANRGDERSISMDLLGQQNADNCMIGFIPLNEKDRKFCQHSLEWNPDKDFRRNSARTLIRRQQHKTKKKNRRVSIIFQCWWMQASAVTTGGGTRLVRHFDPNNIARPCHQSCTIRIYDEAQRLRNA